ISGIFSPFQSAACEAFQKSSACFSQSGAGALLSSCGALLPPARIDPSLYFFTSSGVTKLMSAWTICPTFSSTLIRLRMLPIHASDQPFKRGVNVLGYDPYWTDMSKRRFEWRHFAEIRKAGFDFVRVNLQAFSHMDGQNRLDPVWLAKLDDVVREAQKAGLGVIIDEHDFNACSEDLAVCRAKLPAFWRQVAPRYANAPRNVAFEILNEPHEKLDAANWNALVAELLPVVRQTNPTRIVVVGPTSWNSFKELPSLKLPPDPNLLVTFHYY